MTLLICFQAIFVLVSSVPVIILRGLPKAGEEALLQNSTLDFEL